MKLQLYLNREPLPETVKAGDVLTGVQICPIGDWPHGETVQHVTEDACRKMIDAATAEILVDFDHDAEEGGSTKAAAWLSNLRLDPERGLVGDFKFTDVGAEAVASRRFRFLSPCWECEEVVVDSGSGRTAPFSLMIISENSTSATPKMRSHYYAILLFSEVQV